MLAAGGAVKRADREQGGSGIWDELLERPVSATATTISEACPIDRSGRKLVGWPSQTSVKRMAKRDPHGVGSTRAC
jgi:hypothetical protein